MKIINALNVNQAYDDALAYMRLMAVRQSSRNGPVLKAPGPVVTTYRNPWERILWDPLRDANPVSHLMESMWMFAGKRDVDPILPFNERFSEYAESDGTVWGAYGYRWRQFFDFDQIKEVVRLLKKDHDTRRAVVSMWDPKADSGALVQDVPCNTHIYFNVRGEELTMTVCCRSNDMIRGAYGADAVHMSMLHELVASAVDLQMGDYTQFSNDFHIYENMPRFQEIFHKTPLDVKKDLYIYADRTLDGSAELADSVLLLAAGETLNDFLRDAEDLFESFIKVTEFRTQFVQTVAAPLRDVYLMRRLMNPEWKEKLESIPTCDWKVAFTRWAARREA